MSKECSSCERKETESPGCLLDCVTFSGSVNRHNMGWQPKGEPEKTCGTCGGHGVVCSQCGEFHRFEKKNHYWDAVFCPTCQPPEKQLEAP